MSGLPICELEPRGLAERILIVCPANLAFQWLRELKKKFRRQVRRPQGPGHLRSVRREPVAQAHRIITSLDLAKRHDILPGRCQVTGIW